MNLLLGLLATVGMTSPTVASISNNNNLNNLVIENDKIENINPYQKVVIKNPKTNDSKVDVSHLSPGKIDEEIEQFILIGLLETNSDELMFDIIFDLIYFREDWDVVGMPERLPEVNTSINASLVLKAKPQNDRYVGFITFKVEIVNGIIEPEPEPEKVELSEAVKITNLGKFLNPNEDKIINQFFRLNSNINRNEVALVSIDYSQAIFRSTTDKYQGEVTVTYSSDLELNNRWVSDQIHVEVYNSTQHDSREYRFSYYPVFGLENLRKAFKGISYDSDGIYKVKTFNEDKWTVVPRKITTVAIDSGRSMIWHDEYFGSVNWNTSDGFLDLVTNNKEEKIDFKFRMEVSAHASWVNAYWARAGGQMNINNIHFVK